jgi:hypothetical protein
MSTASVIPSEVEGSRCETLGLSAGFFGSAALRSG